MVFLYSSVGFSQTVSVDNSQSAPALVDILLDDACANVSNISSSSMQATGSFSNNGGAFPIADGVIIRTGNAGSTSGSYTGNNLDSQLNTNSDPYLQDLLDRSGRSAIVAETAFLEFDFVPISNVLSFDFLLASNEYGVEQCNSSDVLAFVLTDLETGTETNLAVIPGSNTPITVQNIKDNTYNPVCPSVNAELFASYEVNNAQSTVNMRGYTSVLTAASSALVPGRAYKMRIVIGDANDSRFDSAIFISAGSFNTGVNLGADFSICDGDETVLESGLTDAGYTFKWLNNGEVIPGETSTALTITEPGDYKVEVSRQGNNCLIDDEIVVSALQVTQPQPLFACYTESGTITFDLTENGAAALGIMDEGYEMLYYASQQELDNGTPIPAGQLTSYVSTGNQTIFIKLRNTASGNFCEAPYPFQLDVSKEIKAIAPVDVDICIAPGEDGEVDLSKIVPTFPNGEDPAAYEVTYYSALRNAQDGLDAIDPSVPYTIPEGTVTRTIYMRVAFANQSDCYLVISFVIRVGALPLVDELEDVVSCGSYILPPLVNGNYYTQANGEGIKLNAGDVVNADFTQTIYIYNESADGCPSEPSSFLVTFPDKFVFKDIRGCATKFKLPFLPEDAGAFYTAAGGPNGGGTEFKPEQVLSKVGVQTIYYYAEVDGAVCIDKGFEITIDALPDVDKPNDEIVCTSYILPPLKDGTYNTQADGKGKTFTAGDEITETQTIYIFNQDINCTNAWPLEIFIAPTYEEFKDARGGFEACGSYDLPEITKGAYYTEALGKGNMIPPDEPLTTSQTVYYYVATTSGTNCTNNLSFYVTVKPIPPVDSLPSVSLCETKTFTLPALKDGQYFTASNRGGTQLAIGEVINATQTIYISNLVNGCESKPSEFTVTIRPKPPIDNFVAVNACDVYELPVLKNGTFYTAEGGPNGTGEVLEAGVIIDQNSTLWIYNEYDDLEGCVSDKSFEINILGVEVGEFDDVVACDAYLLPQLSNGNYYTAPRGRGMRLEVGELITETQEIFVYARKGTRFICEDPDISEPPESFTVTISETPLIEPTNDVEQCGSYTLPTLDQTDFDFAYYRAPNGQDPIAASEYTLDQPGSYTIYRYATAKNNKVCFDEDLIQVTIYPLLDFSVVGGTVCTDAVTGEVVQSFTFESGLDPAEFEVSWSLNNEVVHVGATHDAMAAGTYTVSTVKINPEMGADCNYNPTTVEVLASSQPNIEAEVSQPFADVSVITVKVVNGDGDYEYQIDGGEFQTSNEFYDVQPGTHEISARGITGNCDATTITVNVINYPKFFTPNADGFNDVWNIDSLQDYQDAQIVIFDRYGKLLKTIFPDGNGWDGTFRGENMPSDDYWFKVNFVDEKGMPVEFKAHFTLKR